jgi:hypothetical protein
MLRAVLFSLVLAAGCATAAPPAAVETVGTLAPSYHSIATAPVHATTDLSPGVQAVSTDDDAPVSVGSGEAVEAPELAPKAGLVMGGVR